MLQNLQEGEERDCVQSTCTSELILVFITGPYCKSVYSDVGVVTKVLMLLFFLYFANGFNFIIIEQQSTIKVMLPEKLI